MPARWHFPIVLIDRAGPTIHHDAVVLDNHSAATILVEHLHAVGFTRIAALFGKPSSTGVERHTGYLTTMVAAGVQPQVWFVPPTMASATGDRRFWPPPFRHRP